MRKRQGGVALVGLGLILAVVAVMADPIGLGDGFGVGYQQLGLLVVAVALAAFGAYVARGA